MLQDEIEEHLLGVEIVVEQALGHTESCHYIVN